MKRFTTRLIILSLVVTQVSFIAQASASKTCLTQNQIISSQGTDLLCTKTTSGLALMPTKVRIPKIEITDVRLIPDGFRAQIKNFVYGYSFTATTTSGRATIDEGGSVSVTNMRSAKGVLKVRIYKNDKFRELIYSGFGFNLPNLQSPELANDFVQTLDGMQVQITNFDPAIAVEVLSSFGYATVNNSGLIEVVGVSTEDPFTLKVKFTRVGYMSSTRSYIYHLIRYAPTPDLYYPTISSTWMSIKVRNYDARFQWTVTSNAGDASIDPAGLVMVTDVHEHQLVKLTVTAGGVGITPKSADYEIHTLPEYPEYSPTQFNSMISVPTYYFDYTLTVWGLVDPADIPTTIKDWDLIKVKIGVKNSETTYIATNTVYITAAASILSELRKGKQFTAKIVFMAPIPGQNGKPPIPKFLANYIMGF
jgi:hypothetical protein